MIRTVLNFPAKVEQIFSFATFIPINFIFSGGKIALSRKNEKIIGQTVDVLQ